MEAGRQYQLNGNTLEKVKQIRKWYDKIGFERTCQRFSKSKGGSKSSIKNYIRISRRPAIMLQLLDRPTLPLSKILTLMKLKDHEIDSKMLHVLLHRPLKELQDQVYVYIHSHDQIEDRYRMTETQDFKPSSLPGILEGIQDYLSLRNLEATHLAAKVEPGANEKHGAFALVVSMNALKEALGVVELFGVTVGIPYPVDLISSVDRRTKEEVKKGVENRAVKVIVACKTMEQFVKTIDLLQRYIEKEQGYDFD